MMTRLGAMFGRVFPDREIYIRSEGSMRYLTVGGGVQAVLLVALLGLAGWGGYSAISAYLAEGELAYRDQAMIELRESYEARVARLQARYDRLLAERDEAEDRFDALLKEFSGKHGELTSTASVEVALQGQLAALRKRVREVTAQHHDTLTALEDLRLEKLAMERDLAKAKRAAADKEQSLADFVATLDETVGERDTARRRVGDLNKEVGALNARIEEIRRHQALVLAQLEEATEASLGQLERVLKRTGVNVDKLVREIERAYTGQGGPFVPIDYRPPKAAEGFPLTEDAVGLVLDSLGRVNSIRIALQKLPLAVPLRAPYRRSSGFGPRRHPVTGRWQAHNGYDMAAPKGTKIFAPVGGRVVFAGTQRGYGKVVKIRHDLGYQTVYAHMSVIRVKKGDRIARWQHIGDVGNTGRSTGNHLHYEIRRYGKPLNPAKYIEAGRNVF